MSHNGKRPLSPVTMACSANWGGLDKNGAAAVVPSGENFGVAPSPSAVGAEPSNFRYTTRYNDPAGPPHSSKKIAFPSGEISPNPDPLNHPSPRRSFPVEGSIPEISDRSSSPQSSPPPSPPTSISRVPYGVVRISRCFPP